MKHKDRVKIIEKIQEKRNSRVVTLITSDRMNLGAPVLQQMNDVVYSQLRTIKRYGGKWENIDLFLYSRGGDSDAPWSIVSTIREVFPDKKFNVLVPFRAHSAATMLGLGADELVMTEKAELGSVDITISNHPLNPPHPITKRPIDISVEDVMGFLGLMERLNCKKAEEKIKAFEILSEHINPLAIGMVNRMLEQTKLIAERMLSSRKNILTKDENDEIVRKLSSEIYSHRHTILRTEARQLGITFIRNAEDYKVHDLMWKLYEQYAETLEMNEPFNPEKYLTDNNIENHKWYDLKKAIIETQYESYEQLCDVEVKRIRQINQPVNLNPQISLPTMPQPPQQQLAGGAPTPPLPPQPPAPAILQEWLSKNMPDLMRESTKLAMDMYLKTQPSGPVEIKIIDKFWKKI
jgi:hypothetical protein